MTGMTIDWGSVRLAQILAVVFISIAAMIALFGLWLIVPYFH